MKSLKASEEFVIGKHGIGFVSSSFEERFGDKEFEEIKGTPKYQKLPRAMTDKEIESELKPGICSLSDVLAFLKNPPEESKDGCWNIFYFPTCVVRVGWGSGCRDWSVSTWQRGDDRWSEGIRVFSPATGLRPSEVEHYSETLHTELEKAVDVCKKAGLRVYKEL